MEQVTGWSVLQLLGAGPSLSLCKGADGSEGADAYHCVCVVRPHFHYNIAAMDFNQSSKCKFADWRFIHFPLINSIASSIQPNFLNEFLNRLNQLELLSYFSLGFLQRSDLFFDALLYIELFIQQVSEFSYGRGCLDRFCGIYLLICKSVAG